MPACTPVPPWEGLAAPVSSAAESALNKVLDDAWPGDDPLRNDPVFADDPAPEDLPHEPGPLSSTPSRADLGDDTGTTTKSAATLNVTKVCGVDEGNVKQPLEMEWSAPSPATDRNATDVARSETHLQFFFRRAAEWLGMCPATEARSEPPGLTQLERVAWVAAKLRVTVHEFLYAVDNDLRHLDRFAALAVQEDDESPLEGAAEPGSAAAFADLPAVLGPAHRTAPAAYVDAVGADGLPPQFAKPFHFYSMFKRPEWARQEYEKWQAQTMQDAERCFAAYRENRVPKGKSRRPLVFLPEHFHDCLVGRHIDCSNHEACFVTSASDREANYFTPEGSQADTIKHAQVAADLTPDYSDQEFIHELRYGHDTKSKQPWCLVLCSMNASAAADLGVVAKAIDTGITNGWLSKATHVTAVPAVYEPFGIGTSSSCEPGCADGRAQTRLILPPFTPPTPSSVQTPRGRPQDQTTETETHHRQEWATRDDDQRRSEYRRQRQHRPRGSPADSPAAGR